MVGQPTRSSPEAKKEYELSRERKQGRMRMQGRISRNVEMSTKMENANARGIMERHIKMCDGPVDKAACK